MNRLIALLLLCLPLPALALSVAGVDVAEKVHVGSGDLQLNGAGIRTKYMFKVYVAALYLGDRKKTAEDVLADDKPKRVTLHMLRHVDAGEFMEAFRKAIMANLTRDEFNELALRFLAFAKVFTDVGQVDKGDVITLDYAPGVGTVVSVNGKERKRVEGADFFRGMLKIWLGEKPVDEGLKKKMLGAA